MKHIFKDYKYNEAEKLHRFCSEMSNHFGNSFSTDSHHIIVFKDGAQIGFTEDIKTRKFRIVFVTEKVDDSILGKVVTLEEAERIIVETFM